MIHPRLHDMHIQRDRADAHSIPLFNTGQKAGPSINVGRAARRACDCASHWRQRSIQVTKWGITIVLNSTNMYRRLITHNTHCTETASIQVLTIFRYNLQDRVRRAVGRRKKRRWRTPKRAVHDESKNDGRRENSGEKEEQEQRVTNKCERNTWRGSPQGDKNWNQYNTYTGGNNTPQSQLRSRSK